MTPEQFLKVQEIFDLVQDTELNQRDQTLMEACKGDTFLQEEVEKLLVADASAGDFLVKPILPFLGTRSTNKNSKSLGASLPTKEFTGNDRFIVQKRLGEGTFGIVYEVYDKEWNQVVALKYLKSRSSKALLSFKKEFRLLISITHPNLVNLYEFFFDNDQWFFTMELVKGKDFRTYTLQKDHSKTLQAFLQLVQGIKALHQAGKLHRDIKPSNVLVTEDDRVVLLDFGLVAEQASLGVPHSFEAVGTPIYMSPEQTRGFSLTEASDWYSVGVMLFESLTGRTPFSGDPFTVLRAKQNASTLSPKELIKDIPDWINDLCARLLQSEIALRPSGDEILELLTSQTTTSNYQPPQQSVFPQTGSRLFLVGRESHFETLKEALATTTQGESSIAYIYGRSGMGKSSLVRHFFKELQTNNKNILLLTSYCYEQEFVPYKALDGLIDALTQYLKRLPSSELESLLPSDTTTLLRLFPVLRQIKPIVERQLGTTDVLNPTELRKSGAIVLKQLLISLSQKTTLVLFIDDVQWADQDSAIVFEQIFDISKSPAILLIVCYRSENASSTLVEQFRSLPAWKTYDVPVLELTLPQAQDMIVNLLGKDLSISKERINTIADESGGSPFFLHELIQCEKEAIKQVGIVKTKLTSLEEVIQSRIKELPKPAREFLELVSIANRPMPRSIVKQSLKLVSGEQNIINLLKTQNLIRSNGLESNHEIEPYHDRIRETVVASLSQESLKANHLNLALILEMEEEHDVEKLAIHFQEAGESVKALPYAIKAANQASELLAFYRAARFYQLSIEIANIINPNNSINTQELKIKLAESLSYAGYISEAGKAYLEAAQSANTQQSVPFHILAANHFIKSGFLEEGFRALKTVCEGFNLYWPNNKLLLLLSIIYYQLELKWQGLNFQIQDRTNIPLQQILKLDIYYAGWLAAYVGDMRGIYFHSLHMSNALSTGDPYHLSIAFSTEAALISCEGNPALEKAQKLCTQGLTLAEQIQEPYPIAMAKYMNTFLAMHLGQWSEVVSRANQAEDFFYKHCMGAYHEIHTCQCLSIWGSFYLGQIKKLSEKIPEVLKSFRDRKDFFNEINTRCWVYPIWYLMDDQPDKVEEEVSASLKKWPNKAFSHTHAVAFFRQLMVELYKEDGKAAWRRVKKTWLSLITCGILLRVQMPRAEAYYLRGLAALAAITDGLNPRTLIRNVKKSIKELEKVGLPYATAWAFILKAGLLAYNKEHEQLIKTLELAEDACEKAEMKIHQMAVRYRRGQIVGGELGKELTSQADQWMKEETIKKPEKITIMYVGKF